VRFLLNL
jgi:integrase